MTVVPIMQTRRILGVGVHVSGTILPPPETAFWRLETAPTLGLDAWVNVVDTSRTVAWDLEQGGLVLRLPTDEYDQSSALYVASWFAAERKRQQHGHYWVDDAACVAGPAGAVLLIGGSGSGKTSVALALGLLHEARCVSGGHSPIHLEDDTIVAFGHSAFFQLRAYSMLRLAQELPEISTLLPADTVKWMTSAVGNMWEQKGAFRADDLGLTVPTETSPITLAVFLRVVPDICLSWQRLESGDVRNKLSSATAKLINGGGTLLDNRGNLRCAPISSHETDVVDRRLRMLAEVGKVPGIRLVGSLPATVSFLAEFLQTGELRLNA
jgi:hypothetical protein